MIRSDLEAAGIACKADGCYADFHSLRSCYISALIRSGASIKIFQTLARHAKASTTLQYYAKASLFDLTGAVTALPDPASVRPVNAVAAGTDVQAIEDPLSQHFPNGKPGRLVQIQD
jgi:hypothetical protein